MIEFDEEDKELWIKTFHKEMEEYKHLTNNEIYNEMLRLMKQEDMLHEQITETYRKFMTLNNIFTLRLIEEEKKK